MTGPRLSIIPAGAVLDRRLKARDLQVLCVFGKHTDKNGWCCRSQVKMAMEMGCARSTVQASIERLVAAGWLQKRILSTPHESGERDRAHEYRVVLDVADQTQDVDTALPTDRHPLPTHESAPPADSRSAPINVCSLTDPSSNEGAHARGGGGFDILWSSWPTCSLPTSREAAEAIFGKLAIAEQVRAVDVAKTFVRLCALRKKAPLLIAYLKQRKFDELYGAPPLDEEGRFLIKPGLPEWSHWLGAIRQKYGESGVQNIVKTGFYRAETRWPQAAA